jgi:hypothetical protein
MAAFKSGPGAALARLHAIAQTQEFPSDTFFALAELSFLQAGAGTEQQSYVQMASRMGLEKIESRSCTR